jgi:hypothetical protein
MSKPSIFSAFPIGSTVIATPKDGDFANEFQGRVVGHKDADGLALFQVRDQEDDVFDCELSQLTAARSKGAHLFVPMGGHPRCADCGCDEDDAFVGGEECTFIG